MSEQKNLTAPCPFCRPELGNMMRWQDLGGVSFICEGCEAESSVRFTLDEAYQSALRPSRQLAVLREENERLRKDAARYRWLRSDGIHHINFKELTPDTCDIGLDFAIDQEISASGESEGK